MTTLMQGVTLEQARRLHDLGFSVLPLRPRSKEPDPSALPKGADGKATWLPYQQLRPTDEELVAWFGNGVPRNAGAIPRQLFVVVDGDTPEALAWMQAELPPTPWKSRTDRGEHWYYSRPDGVEEIPNYIHVREGLSIEVKSGGNHYVVAPGSVHPSGASYEEIEPWTGDRHTLPTFPMSVFGAGTRTRTQATAAPLPEVLAEGGRNNTLFKEGCRLRRLGLQEDELLAALRAMNVRRCDPPLSTREVETIAKSCAKYTADDAGDFPLTEQGDAEFFVSMHGDAVRFDHRQQRWLVFDEHVWTPQTTGELHRLAIDAIRARQRMAVGNKERMKWAIGGEQRSRQSNLLALAQNIEPVADAGDSWDINPWLVGTPNGVLDLQKSDFRRGRPDDRVTLRVRVPFDPKARCPLWEDKVAEIFGGDTELVRYVQRAVGYSLSGDCREEVFFLLWGDGANGKSTLISTIGFVLGDYSDDLPAAALERSRFGGGIPNDIAKLVGRRFVTSSECNDIQLNEARVKALTGRDPITARFLHREFFTFEPMAKFWLTANDKPRVRDNSEGFWRRVHLIPFTQSFIGREDRSLKDRLRAEAQGILTWAVEGALRWQRDGLQPPKVVTDATSEYRNESQQLGRFLDACCVVQDGARTPAGQAFAAYRQWCQSEHEPMELNQKTFGLAMKKRFTADESPRRVVYVGVGLMGQLAFEGGDAYPM